MDVFVCKSNTFKSWSRISIFFYIYGPTLRNCDTASIRCDEDIYKYFKGGYITEQIIHQVEIGTEIRISMFKKYGNLCNPIIREIEDNNNILGKAIIRTNNSGEGFQRFSIPTKTLFMMKIKDETLLKHIIPNYNLYDMPMLRNSNINVLSIEKYMRRLWIRENGLLPIIFTDNTFNHDGWLRSQVFQGKNC